MPDQTPQDELARRFAAPEASRCTVAALTARADAFHQALARGGTRAEVQRWTASLQTLQAALAIVRAPAPSPVNEGEPRWKSLLARSAAR